MTRRSRFTAAGTPFEDDLCAAFKVVVNRLNQEFWAELETKKAA